MKLVVRTTERRFEAVRRKLLERGASLDASVESRVRDILADVQRRGDRAVAAATLRFDRVRCSGVDWLLSAG